MDGVGNDEGHGAVVASALGQWCDGVKIDGGNFVAMAKDDL